VFSLTNLHGDIAATANAVGTLGGTQDYDEFGRPRVPSERYGWLGGYLRRTDATSGAVFMGLRVYEPALGRFLQVDPVYGGSANSYDYVDGDPVTGLVLNGTLTACTLNVYRPFYNSGRIYGSAS
jgi:RHS repeat-associated protein